MSDQIFTPSGKAALGSSEAEYNAVYAAVTATERGRWFLAEYANRNRKADTDLILAAIARIESAIHAGAVPQTAASAPVQANSLREDAAAIVPIESVQARGGERDEDVADRQVAPISAPDPSPADARSAASALTDQDYSDAVAAIAASLTTRLEESTKDSVEDENSVEAAGQESLHESQLQAETPSALAERVFPAVAPEAPAVPSRHAPQDNSPRWHIEGPDFVFGSASQGEGSTEPRQSTQHHAQLLGAQLMSAPTEAPTAAREEAAREEAAREVPVRFDTSLELQPAPAAPEVAVAAPVVSLALEIVPLTDVSRPQLRIAHEGIRETAPVVTRPPRYGSLTVNDALSEDEVIALFG